MGWLRKATGSSAQGQESGLCTLQPAWFPCRILESQSLKRWWMGQGPKRYAKSRQGYPHLTRAPRLRAVSIIPWTISSKPSAALRTAGVRAYRDGRKPNHETRPLCRGRWGSIPAPCEELRAVPLRAVASGGNVMGRRGRGRPQAWDRGVENGSLVFCADVRPDVEVSHEWVPDVGGAGAWRHPL